MGDRKFTFIELHLDGETQFGPKEISDALPGGRKVEVDAETETEDDDEDASTAEDDSGGKSAVGAVVGVLLLVGLAVAFKKLRGDDETPIEEYDEPDVIVN